MQTGKSPGRKPLLSPEDERLAVDLYELRGYTARQVCDRFPEVELTENTFYGIVRRHRRARSESSSNLNAEPA